MMIPRFTILFRPKIRGCVVVGTAVMVLAVFSPLAAQNNDPRLQSGEMLTFQGKIVVPASGASGTSGTQKFTLPAGAGPFSEILLAPPGEAMTGTPLTPANILSSPNVNPSVELASNTISVTTTAAYILAKPPDRTLGVKRVTDILSDLFSWPDSSKYASFFLMLPGPQDLRSDVASHLTTIPADQVYAYRPYNVTQANVSLQVLIPATIKPLPPFQTDAKDAIFVVLDGFGKKVPVVVANEAEAGFMNGLVTRLVLGQYARAWKAAGSNIALNQLKIQFPSTPVMADFDAANIWTKPTFADSLQNVLENFPVQPAGTLWGWQAGDDLDNLSGPDAKYRQDVLKLIGSRFTTQQLGEITAYTLNYVIGFLKTDRIAGIISSANTAQPALKDTALILKQLSNDQGVNDARALLAHFHESIAAEFYALSVNSSLQTSDKTQILQDYFAFLNGFETGSIAAADQVFADVFRFSYGLGYKDGFKDGYTQGYSAGYRDGFAAGYAQAWKEANVVINRLQAELNDAKSQNSFWNNIGKVASTVGTVVGAIVAIFG